MRKALFVIATVLAASMLLATPASAQLKLPRVSQKSTLTQTIGLTDVTINYSRPGVKGRTIWGDLVPYDKVWRTGANEATHLATSKTIQLGEMTLAPGLYTLWTQHTRSGTSLIVNRQVGQWGTVYNAANDIGRVPLELANAPEFVEDFTITIRSLGQNRGAIDLAWGDKVATANFMVRP